MPEVGFGSQGNPGDISKREVGNDYNVDVENWFTYHPPTPEQTSQYEKIRATAKAMAYAIIRNTPKSADSRAAMRKLRECVMTANAAIACGGK